MGNSASSIKYINFEEVIKSLKHAIIINTLPATDQQCLIEGTILARDEEEKINELISTNKRHTIIVYGKNCADVAVIKKATQLRALGFDNVSVYVGGLFEWLLLQDIYGSAEFKTTRTTVDLLKYK